MTGRRRVFPATPPGSVSIPHSMPIPGGVAALNQPANFCPSLRDENPLTASLD